MSLRDWEGPDPRDIRRQLEWMVPILINEMYRYPKTILTRQAHECGNAIAFGADALLRGQRSPVLSRIARGIAAAHLLGCADWEDVVSRITDPSDKSAPLPRDQYDVAIERIDAAMQTALEAMAEALTEVEKARALLAREPKRVNR